MKAARIAVLAVLGFAPLAPTHAAEPSLPTWEKLKTLVGEWEGRYEGKAARLSYRLVSSGTTLMETLDAPDSTQMVTMYHPDGDSLLMTHYCSMGNQPRMRARGLKDGWLDFGFVDIANMKSPAEHHIKRLRVHFVDATHLVQEWTSKVEDGKEEVGRFEFTRKQQQVAPIRPSLRP